MELNQLFRVFHAKLYYKDWVNYSHSAAELQAVADKISRKPLNGMNILKQYADTPDV